jgi:hypothetical protein
VRKKSSATGDLFAFFYCSGVREAYGNSSKGHASSDASYILRSILRQFGQGREAFELLSAGYRAKKNGKEEMELQEVKDLLCSTIEMHEKSFIVLDAMDECDDPSEAGERLNLMEIFEQLLSLDVPVKVFCSSRPESDIQDFMKEWPSIYLNVTATEHDIANYVDRTIDRKLKRKRGCDDDLRGQLKTQLKDRAKGV